MASSRPSGDGGGDGVLDAERLRQAGKIGGGGGTGIAGDAGEDDVGHLRPEDLGHLVDGFVGHGAKEQHQGTLAELFAEGGAQGPGAGGIVGDVDDDLRAVGGGGKALEASRPEGLAGAAGDALRQ